MDKLRIHGDNILECERALDFIVEAFGISGATRRWVKSAPYAPRYEIVAADTVIYEVQLFPGYGRWSFPIERYLQERGAHLREKTDAVVTRLVAADGGKLEETPVVAFEFCGSLPAGNNAWQRCGRALAAAAVGMPYLYFAEIGGIELDENRSPKAPRWPNPLVPFAYLTLGKTFSSVALPIFVASPSVDEKVAEPFDSTFGYPEARALVRELLVGGDTRSIVEVLERKATEVVRVLAAQRKRGDTLQSDDWTHLAAESSGSRKARWLVNKEMGWRKKLGLKTVTATFRGLLRAAGEVGCVAVGSQDMPLCIIDASKRSTFGAEAAELYGKKISPEFQAWLSSPGKPLLCIWVAGFKPRGDDSRPDRGLIPLGRMLFGFGDVDLLTIVYGPAQPATWRLLERDMWGLARINGLWEAIVGLSEGILVDSPTGTGMQRVGLVVSPPSRSSQLPSTLSAASEVPNFSEHDVDSTLHLVFSGSVLQGVFEAMCNPPGGDWSGLAYHSFASAQEYKWTSLPRVSRGGGKRPDHVIEFALSSGAETILSIESKDLMQTLETGVGPRLTKYVEDLLAVAPTVSRPDAVGIWRPYQGRKIYPLPRIISGAAIRYSLPDELSKALKTGKVDVSFGVEFLPLEERVVVHVLAKPHTAWLGQKMVELTKRFDGRIIVQIH